jgi:RNA recognition motif-containing protein
VSTKRYARDWPHPPAPETPYGASRRRREGAAKATSKVYVGNLPGSATEVTLAVKFSEHGKVFDVKLITDHGTGRSLGYAFVEMATAADATRVIEDLDGERYDGSNLIVRRATPKR